MTAIKEMYIVLEQMVERAADGQEQKVLELNKLYELLVQKVYHSPPTRLELEYDRCRTSCVMSVTMFKDKHQQLIMDAQEIFSRIPEPNR